MGVPPNTGLKATDFSILLLVKYFQCYLFVENVIQFIASFHCVTNILLNNNNYNIYLGVVLILKM